MKTCIARLLILRIGMIIYIKHVNTKIIEILLNCYYRLKLIKVGAYDLVSPQSSDLEKAALKIACIYSRWSTYVNNKKKHIQTYTMPAPAGAIALKKDIKVVAKPFAVAL
jgi:hypothetical protein